MALKKKKAAAPASTDNEIIVEMVKDKETPGSFRYAEQAFLDKEEYQIGSLYIRKSVIGDEAPETINVTITY